MGEWHNSNQQTTCPLKPIYQVKIHEFRVSIEESADEDDLIEFKVKYQVVQVKVLLPLTPMTDDPHLLP